MNQTSNENLFCFQGMLGFVCSTDSIRVQAVTRCYTVFKNGLFYQLKGFLLFMVEQILFYMVEIFSQTYLFHDEIISGGCLKRTFGSFRQMLFLNTSSGTLSCGGLVILSKIVYLIFYWK